MTIFAVQHFLEDQFDRRGLTDVDQYAVRVANAFDRADIKATPASLAVQMGRIKTAFFRRNQTLERRKFEGQLAVDLLQQFKKKSSDAGLDDFRQALGPARKRLKAKRRSIAALLCEFKTAFESRGVDSIWKSRVKRQLRARPEKLVQSMLGVFASGVLRRDGLILREIYSGIGFVDVGIVFGHTLHLIELKILKGKMEGVKQLAKYMRTEQRKEGWLLVVDVRKHSAAKPIPASIVVAAGKVKIVVVEANPIAPSAL